MNSEEYEDMINTAIEELTEVMFAAADRNHYKDRRIYAYRLPNNQDPLYNYVKGWEGFDLKPKLLEEYNEVVENPCSKEIGDLAWVLAMMLDQIRHSPSISKSDSSNKEELK
jgi:hypothetical protein